MPRDPLKGMTSHQTSIDKLLSDTDWLQKLARQLVSDPDQAQDLAQETALAGIADGEQLRGEARPWLASVARRTGSRLARRERRQKELEERAQELGHSPSVLDTVAKFELHRSVVDAVHALPEPYRRIVLLRFWEGLLPRKIAGQLDTPVETVKTQLSRGLSMLRKKLDQVHESRSAWVGPLSLWLRPATALGIALSPKLMIAIAVIGLGTVSVWLQSTWNEAIPRSPEGGLAAALTASTSDDGRGVSGKVERQVLSSQNSVGQQVLVHDAAGKPVQDALVFSSFAGKSKAWAAKEQELSRLLSSPKPGDPNVYLWMVDSLEHSRTGKDGKAEVSLPGGGGALFAFTDTLEGGLRIKPEQTVPLALQLCPRRTKPIAVVGLDGARLDGIPVGYWLHGSAQHAAWTKDGAAVVPLFGITYRMVVDPTAAKGEYAILLPLGPKHSVSVDLRADDDSELLLSMPVTGTVNLVCKDKEGRSLAVDGVAKLIVDVPGDIKTSGELPLPRRFPGARTEIIKGLGSFPQVGLDFPFRLSIRIVGRETPIVIRCEGLFDESTGLTIPIVISEDRKALLRAAEDRRRASIAAQILAEETMGERQLIQKATEEHDEWTMNVIVNTMTGHGSFDRSIVTLRRFLARQDAYYSSRLHNRYRSTGVRQAYHGLAHHAPEDLIREYNRQLGQSDLAEHRLFILTAIGFYSNDKTVSLPFIVSVFRHDPDPLVRATSLYSIGSDADLGTCEQVFLEAIADPLVLPHVIGKLSNFFNRAKSARIRRVCEALLKAPELSDKSRASVEAILQKH